MPEFFCGLDRLDVATPIPMPTSCSPQAWSSASPLLLLRLLLGLEPDDEHGLSLSPLQGAPISCSAASTCGDGVYDVRATDAVEVVRSHARW